jgi:zinc transport system substrate-binding protein
MAVMTARYRSRTRSTRPRIAAALLAGTSALGMLALSACGTEGSNGEGEDSAGTVDVVASFYPMEFLAERIGGDHVSVNTLTEPGVEPHDLELSPRETARLSEADLIVYLAGLQPAVDRAVAESGVPHIVEAASFTESGADDAEHDADEHDAEHGDEHDAEHSDGDGHGHTDGTEDPHLWLDPVKYAKVAEGVGEALAEADPEHAADYRANADGLVAELRTLHEDFERELADTENDTFITTHAAFGYLAERYGLREEAIAGLSPESEPSAARMRELHRVAEEENVRTVFFETLASDATARTLADDLDLDTDVLDPLEGITDESRGTDYLEVMRSNLAALRKALDTP